MREGKRIEKRHPANNVNIRSIKGRSILVSPPLCSTQRGERSQPGQKRPHKTYRYPRGMERKGKDILRKASRGQVSKKCRGLVRKSCPSEHHHHHHHHHHLHHDNNNKIHFKPNSPHWTDASRTSKRLSTTALRFPESD
ncbi:hypothetical protein E2C01_086089 [Portunus trituberculatus]|uniref:Uncharacterized protein n=1 Tax=Portunus trituberculatus TaxID=210409 RepID=A0A5B7J8Q9_PORTR|nr:hypothetical protein [Portunus trituberculatus]